MHSHLGSARAAAFSFPGAGLAPPIPTYEPADLMAGDTATWTKALADASPADGSTLSYAIVGPTVVDGTKLTITPGTDDWTVTIPGSVTALWIAGTYAWTAFVTLAGARRVVDEGVITVRANAATVSAPVISHAAQMVDLLEAEIQARITGTGGAHDSYAINGRSIGKMKMAELEQLRDRYRLELWRERNQNAAAPSRVVRFGAA